MPRRRAELEIGEDLPQESPDVSMERVRLFARSVGMDTGRFTDHEAARRQGLPSAIVPGIMSQALLAAMIHRWAPGAQVRRIDTIFRAPISVDSHPVCRGVVTEVSPEERTVELDLVILNEAGEARVLGTASVRLPEG